MPIYGVPLRREALDEGPMGNRSQQMEGDLRFLMVPHLHVECRCDARDATPLRRPTTPRRIEVADVDRSIYNEVSDSQPGPFTLACGHGDTGDGAHVAHAATVVIPTTRFF